MAGIYLHIPFCRKACTYCDFHFSTQLKFKPAMVQSLLAEANLRKDYLAGEAVQSVYFGGGTPSVLNHSELENLVNKLAYLFAIASDAEITLEANPDDLSAQKISELAEVGVNRLSIGIQSFDNEVLTWMNRSHNAVQATESVRLAQKAGINNISVDLIYGIPGKASDYWLTQLEQLADLQVPHISAYALTVEKETILENWIRQGKTPPPDDEDAHRQFLALSEFLEKRGYEHYELSNFALPGNRAVHNSAYWTGETYLGLGPSAHSFNGESRQWNVSNNQLYLSALESGELNVEKETLSVADQFNEWVMTSLRKKEGMSLDQVDDRFGAQFAEYLMKESLALRREGKLLEDNRQLYIPLEYRFFSDGIAASLFYI